MNRAQRRGSRGVPEGDRRLLLRVMEAAERVALSRAKFYELIATGEVPVLHIGRAVRVPAAELADWVERRFAAAAEGTREG